MPVRAPGPLLLFGGIGARRDPAVSFSCDLLDLIRRPRARLTGRGYAAALMPNVSSKLGNTFSVVVLKKRALCRGVPG